MNVTLNSEDEVIAMAADLARAWRRAGLRRLLIGLTGPLGAGKSTWVRAMLRGLGYEGRVPSPTYTLLEHYRIDDLSVVHMDLYRLAGEDELENLGVRDWLAEAGTWMLVEWPERAGLLVECCDLIIRIDFLSPTARRVCFESCSEAGNRALHAGSNTASNNSS